MVLLLSMSGSLWFLSKETPTLSAVALFLGKYAWYKFSSGHHSFSLRAPPAACIQVLHVYACSLIFPEAVSIFWAVIVTGAQVGGEYEPPPRCAKKPPRFVLKKPLWCSIS